MASRDSYMHPNVVQSTSERRMEEWLSAIYQNKEMLSTFYQIRDAGKIKNWVALLDLFDQLNKQLEKVKSDKPPVVYINALVMLETILPEDLPMKMSKRNAHALNTLKQKLEKNNKNFEELILKFRKNPFEDEDEDEESDKEESDRSDFKDLMQSKTANLA